MCAHGLGAARFLLLERRSNRGVPKYRFTCFRKRRLFTCLVVCLCSRRPGTHGLPYFPSGGVAIVHSCGRVSGGRPAPNSSKSAELVLSKPEAGRDQPSVVRRQTEFGRNMPKPAADHRTCGRSLPDIAPKPAQVGPKPVEAGQNWHILWPALGCEAVSAREDGATCWPTLHRESCDGCPPQS